ncbi:hypothetical protein FH474_09085 [Salmonella enterica]|nr:hypothetical protein [Salmonella enterica]EHL8756253.1 hypothetical protein [Salmonella enterica]
MKKFFIFLAVLVFLDYGIKQKELRLQQQPPVCETPFQPLTITIDQIEAELKQLDSMKVQCKYTRN